MDRFAAAFAACPREQFLPAAVRSRAAYDGPLEIGHGQTNSQPRTVEAMLRLLDVQPGDHVLDVGSGSGWTTALLAHLVGPTGWVRGVEVLPDLVAAGAAHVAATGMAWASVEAAVPGVLGLPGHAPYDRILVSADGGALPEELRDQLADDGVMVGPADGLMLRATRSAVTQHGHYRFVPLVRPPSDGLSPPPPASSSLSSRRPASRFRRRRGRTPPPP
ncbi:protein-L-isoaspartate O-methyltransferase family protein [Nocardioides daphniae]|uniref:Protein-L-isoaspartate O-methyltransferase n=1 Tax=Nocardioides daphniae TaxID=402297 RepID=A0A4P7U933_9ACTN|nr:protein-L-isoaspartate carboxylmethyltransferase [Nocardioides daphniae]QCC76131.1 protein-L-isoaspartate carboxylmethyltransferase [Nocardioides daphniae]GGD09798.1 fibrillarin-like rRNA methylase [Nocardioides daphniae]